MKRINSIVVILVLIAANISAQKILTLDECKQLALKNNAASKNSNLEIEAARQVHKSAFTNFFPNVSASGLMWGAQENLMEIESSGGNLPVYDGNPAHIRTATQFAYMPSSTIGMLQKGTIGYINAVQPIFAGGRIYYGNKLASLGVVVSEYKDKLVKDSIDLKTEDYYWQIVSLDQKMITVNNYEVLLKRLLFQVEDALKAGIALKNDVLKVKLKMSELLLNKSRLNNGKKISMMAFCQHLGVPYDSSLVLNDELKIDQLPQSIFVDKNEAVKRRTEYSLLEKSVEAEKLQTSIKLGEYLPQAGIGVSGMYMKFDESKERKVGLLFGTVSIPISNWWGGSHELQKRSIKEEIAENSFRNNSELLLLQIEKSWQDLTDSYKQYLLCIDSRNQAEENYKVNNDSYKNGISTLSDLLEAQAMLQKTEEQIIEAKADYLMKKSAYLLYTGRK